MQLSARLTELTGWLQPQLAVVSGYSGKMLPPMTLEFERWPIHTLYEEVASKGFIADNTAGYFIKKIIALMTQPMTIGHCHQLKVQYITIGPLSYSYPKQTGKHITVETANPS